MLRLSLLLVLFFLSSCSNRTQGIPSVLQKAYPSSLIPIIKQIEIAARENDFIEVVGWKEESFDQKDAQYTYEFTIDEELLTLIVTLRYPQDIDDDRMLLTLEKGSKELSLDHFFKHFSEQYFYPKPLPLSVLKARVSRTNLTVSQIVDRYPFLQGKKWQRKIDQYVINFQGDEQNGKIVLTPIDTEWQIDLWNNNRHYPHTYFINAFNSNSVFYDVDLKAITITTDGK